MSTPNFVSHALNLPVLRELSGYLFLWPHRGVQAGHAGFDLPPEGVASKLKKIDLIKMKILSLRT